MLSLQAVHHTNKRQNAASRDVIGVTLERTVWEGAAVRTGAGELGAVVADDVLSPGAQAHSL